ncbi:hypothetical protein D3C76_1404830 [compost metagenome]
MPLRIRECAERHHVTVTEHRGRRLWQRQQFFQRQPACGIGKVAPGNIVWIHRRPGAAQRLNVALQAIMTQRHLFRPGDAADAFMAQLLQIVHGVERSGEVINVNSRQFQLGGELVGHHHRRQVALLFNAGIEGQA